MDDIIDVDQLIDALIEREGGYVNNPADKGGPTCFGISEAVARANGFAGAMKLLPRDEAAAIYRRLYWLRPRFDEVARRSPRLAAELFDTGVNMGPAVAVIPECVHCGSADVTRLEGKKHRDGLLQCNKCREQFTVTVGTVFERSKIALNKWLLCNHLLVSSKKGMSALQISRMLGVTYKTAWFMCASARSNARRWFPSRRTRQGRGER